MLRGVIFDMDGVLVDSHPIHKRAWRELLASVGRAVTDAELPAVYASKNPKAKPGDFEKNKINFKQTYLAEKQRTALDAFVKGLGNKATITIDDKALAS